MVNAKMNGVMHTVSVPCVKNVTTVANVLTCLAKNAFVMRVMNR